MTTPSTGTQSNRWLSYGELAWTETVISSVDDYAEQTEYFVTVIPDSIDYMVTLPELGSAINTACRHQKPGGFLLIAAKVREEFRENNFCYTGAREGVEITIFENNYIPRANPATYEATLVYLIRQGACILSVHTDCHTLGLFSRRQWRALFKRAGLHMKQVRLDGAYDRFLLGQGEYPMQVFVGVKPA